MKTVTRIRAEVDSLTFGWWDQEKETFVPLDTEEAYRIASEKLECSEMLLDALVMLTDSMREKLHVDLASIWQRLDDAGI